MRVEQELLTIVELADLGSSGPPHIEKCHRPLILALSYRGSLIGLLTDHISPPADFSELKTEQDSVHQRTFFISDVKNFILFDIPAFYKALESK